MHPQVLHFFKICSEVGSHHKSHAQGQCHATGHSKTERFFGEAHGPNGAVWNSSWLFEFLWFQGLGLIKLPKAYCISGTFQIQMQLSVTCQSKSSNGFCVLCQNCIKGVYYFCWCFNVWIRFLFELFPHKAQGCPNELRRTWSHHLGEWGLWTSDRCGSSTHVPCLV